MALVGMSVTSAATLNPTVNVSNDNSQSILPRVAQDPSGNVHIVWDSNEGSRIIRYAKGTWNGTAYTFGAPQELANVGGHQYATPAIAVAPNGTVMAVWSNGGIQAKTWNSSASGPSGTAVGLGSGIQASIYPDSNSNFHIAWNGDFRLQYCQWNGSSCAVRQAFDDTVNAINRPDITVDSSNNVHIVWDTGQATRYRTRATGTTTFSSISDIGGGNFAQIAADGQGKVHIVRSQDYNIIYCSKTISTGCPTARTLDAAQDLQPSIGATRGGSVVIGWRDTTNTLWVDALENGLWQTSKVAGGGNGVDLSARSFTNRISAVWSQDFDIKHTWLKVSSCEIQGASTEEVSVAAAATYKLYLPQVFKAPPCIP